MVKSRVPFLKKWPKFHPKIDTFNKIDKIGTRDLTNLGAKKSFFGHFVLELLEVVQALFLALKGQLLGSISARKIDI